MSAFHPAVYGALYVALADHKRYLAAAEAVADMYGAGDAIAEYTSAIAGLQETIALLHAGDADAAVDDRLIAGADLGPMHCMLHNTPPIPPGEHCPECEADFDAVDEALAQDEDQPPAPKSREHAVMGQLLPMMADIPTATWQINTGKIEIQVGGVLPDDEVRPAMRAIAASLPGFDYREADYTSSPIVSVEAYAVIDGVKVRIWDHARPAAPARVEAEALGARLNASFPYYLDGTRIFDVHDEHQQLVGGIPDEDLPDVYSDEQLAGAAEDGSQ